MVLTHASVIESSHWLFLFWEALVELEKDLLCTKGHETVGRNFPIACEPDVSSCCLGEGPQGRRGEGVAMRRVGLLLLLCECMLQTHCCCPVIVNIVICSSNVVRSRQKSHSIMHAHTNMLTNRALRY